MPHVLLTLRQLPSLLRVPAGRYRLRYELSNALFPLSRRLAGLRRRAILRNVRLVTVVGSFGKTTTARAVSAALALPEDRLIARNSRSGVVRKLARVRRRDRHAVLEVGITAPGQMQWYATMLRPQVVVVTAIGSEHNRSLGTLETTREEKCAMVRALPADGVAVLNADDPNVMWMAGQTAARVVTFGTVPGSDFRIVDPVVDWPRGTRFRLVAAGVDRDVRARLLGTHSVAALAAAAAVAWIEDREMEATLAVLEAMPPTPGRMEIVSLQGGSWLVRDDFKSSLETIETALAALAEVPAPRRLAVLGEVSEPPASQGEIYRALGERLASSVDAAVFVGGNFQRWARGAVAGGMAREDLVDAGRDLDRAVAAVREKLEPGTVVLVKGRDTQRLSRVSLALSGREVRCAVPTCSLKLTCEVCAMLARGWDGLRIVV